MENRQRVIDEYQRARNPDARLLSCAACGLRESATDNSYSRRPISELGVFKYTHPAAVDAARRQIIIAQLAETRMRDSCRETLTPASVVRVELPLTVRAGALLQPVPTRSDKTTTRTPRIMMYSDGLNVLVELKYQPPPSKLRHLSIY
jgi:hypothetical protein